ncbi:MAG: hypothetical protein AAGA29_05740 [Planctomycetota bacterium]
MADYLPHDLMLAEDDQLLAELDDRTASDIGLNSPTSSIADLLDPRWQSNDEHWRRQETRLLVDGELHILLLYAKLGRNVFLRHQEATAPDGGSDA